MFRSSRTFLPLLFFALILFLMYTLGNQSVQKAEQQDYTMSEVEDQRDYLEGQVSHWYNETMRLQTEVASLREELASRQSDEQNLK